MKLSISIQDGDVEFIDKYASQHGISNRSGVVRCAVALLRSRQLANDYAAAWDEWADTDDADLWDATVQDGTPASPSR